MKICANGTMGYSLKTGEPYVVRNVCLNLPRPGHIHCDSCRKASGGYVKVSKPK